jgi:hypothetical protein
MLHLAKKAFHPAPPPFPLLHVDTTWKFREMYSFRDRMAAETGADLIVHGHEHRDMTESLPGPGGAVPVRGIPSGTYFHNKPDRVARYRIFDLVPGRPVSETVRVWDRAHRGYVLEPASKPGT